MDEVLEQLRSIVATRDERPRRARRAAEAIRDARGYRWVGLYDVAATEIVAIGWSGAVAPAFPRFPLGQGLNGAAVRSARPVVVPDVSADPRYLTTFGSTGAEAIFPVVSSTGEVIGTIGRRARGRFAGRAPERFLVHSRRPAAERRSVGQREGAWSRRVE